MTETNKKAPKERITRIFTGQRKMIPAPETIDEPPECSVALNSYRILRSALVKMWECARIINDKYKGLEAYFIPLTNREDFTITDIIVPEQWATSTMVETVSSSLDKSRVEIQRRNANIDNPDEKWKAVGWSHSHNTMDVFFSHRDKRNQPIALNSAGQKMKRFGQNLIASIGMTVNVRDEVYAETYNRMNCGALISQPDLKLLVVEDIEDEDMESTREKIHIEMQSIVTNKIKERPRERTKRERRKFESLSFGTDSYKRTHRHESVVQEENISAEDMVEEISEGVRSAEDVLFDAVKCIPVKKLLMAVGKNKLQTVLLKVAMEIRKLILDDVEKIVLGVEDFDDSEEEQVEKKQKQPKYMKIIDIVKNETEQRSFGDFAEVVKFGKSLFSGNKLNEKQMNYLNVCRAYMKDRFKENGFSFNVAETSQHLAKKIPKETSTITPSEINSYSRFLEKETSLSLEELSNIRIKLYAGKRLENIVNMSPKEIERKFNVSKGQLIRDKTRQYCKNFISHDIQYSEEENDAESEIDLENKSTYIKNLYSQKQSLIEEYADYLVEKCYGVYSVDKDSIVKFMKRGFEIPDIAKMTSDDIEDMFLGSELARQNAILYTKYFLAEKNGIDKDYAFIFGMDIDAPFLFESLKELAVESMGIEDIIYSTAENLAEDLRCTLSEAADIIEEAKIFKNKAKNDRSSEEYRGIHHKDRVRMYVDVLPLSRNTKQVMAEWFKEHYIMDLEKMSPKDVENTFKCQDWEIRLIKDKYPNKDEISPSTFKKTSTKKNKIIDHIDELSVDRTTKEMLKTYFKNGHTLQTLIETGYKGIADTLGCKKRYAKRIIEWAEKTKMFLRKMAQKPTKGRKQSYNEKNSYFV